MAARTSRAIVTMMTDRSGAEMGDPARVARLIVDAASSPHPPRHLVIGPDAVARARANTNALLADIDAWETRSLATAFQP